MVKAYVHAGKPSKAQEFFEKIGDGPKKDENMSRKMLELLAGAYFGEGMYVESTATYKNLQAKYDGDPMECTWQAAIVVNALASDDEAGAATSPLAMKRCVVESSALSMRCAARTER
jgi:hypothetical protein